MNYQTKKVQQRKAVVTGLCKVADNFNQNITVDSYNSSQDLIVLNALNIEQTDLETIKYRLKTYIEVLEELQEDEDELKGLLISQTNKDFVKDVTVFEKRGDVLLETDLIQEMENLLDIHISQLEDLEETTKQIIYQIERYKDTLRTKQNVIRNNVMMENLKLTRWGLSLSAVLTLVAFPSMNVDFPGAIETTGNYSGFLVVAGVSLLMFGVSNRRLNQMPIYKTNNITSKQAGRKKRFQTKS